MGKFDERKISCKHTCANCKWGYLYEVYWECESARSKELFCMLEASDEDIDYLLDEQPIDDEGEHSPKLLEIMRMEKDDDLYKSRRMMSATNCCQFYEPEGGQWFEEVQSEN